MTTSKQAARFRWDDLPCDQPLALLERRRIIGRLMMLALMREAPVVLVDGSGLLSVEQSMPEAVRILLDYNRETRLQVVLCGVPEALQRTLVEARRQGIVMHEELGEALQQAATLCGLSWSP